MAKADPLPDPEELKRRRQLDPSKFHISPTDVSEKDLSRCQKWAADIMSLNEYKLNNQWKDKDIVTSDVVKPEDIDVMNIYPFPDLHWFIYRDGNYWSLTLASKNKMLFKSTFARIP